MSESSGLILGHPDPRKCWAKAKEHVVDEGRHLKVIHSSGLDVHCCTNTFMWLRHECFYHNTGGVMVAIGTRTWSASLRVYHNWHMFLLIRYWTRSWTWHGTMICSKQLPYLLNDETGINTSNRRMESACWIFYCAKVSVAWTLSSISLSYVVISLWSNESRSNYSLDTTKVFATGHV